MRRSNSRSLRSNEFSSRYSRDDNSNQQLFHCARVSSGNTMQLTNVICGRSWNSPSADSRSNNGRRFVRQPRPEVDPLEVMQMLPNCTDLFRLNRSAGDPDRDAFNHVLNEASHSGRSHGDCIERHRFCALKKIRQQPIPWLGQAFSSFSLNEKRRKLPHCEPGVSAIRLS